ncbi:MAG TPA: TadE family protein [Candidatus Limnocylindria bacterium]
MRGPAAGTDRRGQSLVEFALVLPLFILLVAGLFDIGRAVYASSTISNAARTGARIAIVNQNVDTIRAAAAQEAVALGIPPSDIEVYFRNPNDPALPGNDCPEIVIGCVAVVQVRYQYLAALPIVSQLVGPITLSSTSALRIEDVEP